MKVLTWVVAAGIGALTSLSIASADVIPPGSYQDSCRDFYSDGTTLSATCRTRSGRERYTALRNYHDCRGDIANVDGRLTCVDENSEDDPPRGSYRGSCRNARVNGETLIADCPDQYGRWRSTELANYRWCRGDIANDNGVLRCRAGDGGGYARIILFVRRNYLGGSHTFTRNVTDLRAYGLSNIISSVIVQGGLWELCDRPYFQGECILISRDEPRLYLRRFEDRAESLRRVR